MAEEANVAAAPATEDAPINSNPETTAPASAPAEPQGNYIRLTDEQMKFFSGQGMKSGDELTGKTFDKFKDFLSNPKTPEAPIQTPEPQIQTQPQQAQQPQPQMLQGGITAEEFLMQSYFSTLANQEEYSGISNEIANGEVLKEMSEFGISPMVNGQINDGMVRKFLDMKAKTVPATPQSTPAATTTPTVEYVAVGDKVNTREDAMAVLQQSMELRSAGQPDHPLIKEARDFLAKDIMSK